MSNCVILGGTDSVEWTLDSEAQASTDFRTFSIKLRMLDVPPNDTTFWTIFGGHRATSFGRLGCIGVAQNGFYVTLDTGSRDAFGSVAAPGTGYSFLGTDYFPINKDIIVTLQTSESASATLAWSVNDIRGTVATDSATNVVEDTVCMGFDNDSGDTNTGAKVAIYWAGIWDGDVAGGSVNDEVHRELFHKRKKPQQAAHPASSTNGLIDYFDVETSGLSLPVNSIEPVVNTGEIRFGDLMPDESSFGDLSNRRSLLRYLTPIEAAAAPAGDFLPAAHSTVMVRR